MAFEIKADTARKILAIEIAVGVLIVLAAIWLIRSQQKEAKLTPTPSPGLILLNQ